MTDMWRDAYLQNRVMSADPVELICILYERAIDLVAEARTGLANGDVLARSKAISKLVEILSELEGSLNHQAGGKISQNLERLYRHMRTRLMTANLKQQEQPLIEVESLLKTLGQAWQGIRSKTAQNPSGQPAAAGQAAGNPWGGTEPENLAGNAGDGWSA